MALARAGRGVDAISDRRVALEVIESVISMLRAEERDMVLAAYADPGRKRARAEREAGMNPPVPRVYASVRIPEGNVNEYRTMTVGGIYGEVFRADDIEAAAQMAEAAGYEVVDVMDDIIVITG